MGSSSPPFRITVLGSGTSTGVPTIGCHCAVCRSEDPRDKRLRPSILISYSGRNVVIDTTPDFRTQVLRAKVDRLDAVLFTHSHADHIMGLDDVRPFNFHQKRRIPVYAAPDTLATLRSVFHYVFDGRTRNTSIPQLDVHEFTQEPFDLFGLKFEPIRVLHGNASIYGFRFGDAAYLTDHSDIPEESLRRLRGLDVLFLDALRNSPHPTHSTVERARHHVAQLTPKRTFLTHMSHDLSHVGTERDLPANIRLAYDGLEIEVGASA